MTSDGLKQHALANDKPDQQLSTPLQALWWDAKEEWEEAHKLCQAEDSSDCAWVHAYLHRKEGDEDNARYWYSRAGKQMPSSSLEEEWSAIVSTLAED